MEIRLENVSKAYAAPVLREVSLTLPEGSTTVVMGESGCGKTTLLRLLLGLEQPDSGSISGIPKKLSAVFQEDRLSEDFSALTNAAMATDRHKRAAVRALLEDLGLGDALHRPVRSLSGGMKRRVAIARCLAADAELLVMDEPFSGLDEAIRRRTMALVRQHTAGRTLVLVTHSPEEAAFFGGQLVKMKKLQS